MIDKTPPISAGLTTERSVNLVISHTFDSVDKTCMKGNPATNLKSVKASLIDTKLNTAMTQISAPVDKLETISRFGKVLKMLSGLNILKVVLRRTTHGIVTTVTSYETLPKVIRLTIRISHLEQFFARKVAGVNMGMKATTVIYGPTLIVGTFAHILNLVKALIALQDGGDKLTPRGGTLIHATPFGITVHIPPTVTTASL
jgi:flagellar biosynthesis protein FlhB